MQIQVVHSDRDGLDSMIIDLVSERLPLGGADVDLLGEDLEVTAQGVHISAWDMGRRRRR
jgi:hypothetical protein